MELNKKFIGHTVKSKLHGDIEVKEENIKKLKEVNANVFVTETKPKKKATKKFKGIKEDDNTNTESAE